MITATEAREIDGKCQENDIEKTLEMLSNKIKNRALLGYNNIRVFNNDYSPELLGKVKNTLIDSGFSVSSIGDCPQEWHEKCGGIRISW